MLLSLIPYGPAPDVTPDAHGELVAGIQNRAERPVEFLDDVEQAATGDLMAVHAVEFRVVQEFDAGGEPLPL